MAQLVNLSEIDLLAHRRHAGGNERALGVSCLLRQTRAQRIFLRHADGVETAIDVMGFTRARQAEVGEGA